MKTLNRSQNYKCASNKNALVESTLNRLILKIHQQLRITKLKINKEKPCWKMEKIKPT